MLTSKKNGVVTFFISVAVLICGISQASPVIYHNKLQQIAHQANPEKLKKTVQRLVDFGTRHTLSDTKSKTRGIGAARRWVKKEFESISKSCGNCLKVEFQGGVISGEKRIPNPTEVINVIAIKKGTTDPNRVVMITADIDSRVSDPMNATSDSPGANDNASGLAAVIQAARVLSKYQFNATVVFAALSGEEQGLFGGKILAKEAKKRGWKIIADLNNDMIGNIEGIDGVIDNTHARVFSEGTRVVETKKEARIRRFSGGEVDSPSRNLARYIDRLADQYIDNLDIMMIYRLDRFRRGGHQRPFNEAGYPSVRIMEAHENYNRQHQDIRTEKGIQYGDVIEGVNFPYAAKLTALNMVTLASMAWAPAPPTKVTLKGAVSPDTHLSWQQPKHDKTKIKGYRIYWRETTSPLWQKHRDVGKVNQYTLKNIIIDNYFFGVSAISNEGFESPVVFPGATGAFE